MLLILKIKGLLDDVDKGHIISMILTIVLGKTKIADAIFNVYLSSGENDKLISYHIIAYH